ncbi:MAG: glycosyltransferase, partial [Woeseiaceae bacterium]
MSKIVYLSKSAIPSRTANSVHVMKMCQAFSINGHDVELLAPERGPRRTDAEEPFSFYSVRPIFKLTRIRRSEQKWGAFQYACRASQHAQHARPDLVYGRDIQACFQATLRRLPVILEIHDLAFISRELHHRLAFALLLRAKTFRNLVVISQALAADVVALYPSVAGRVRVAHDGADPVVDQEKSVQPEHDGAMLRAGYIGNIYPGRGLELLESIARRLPWLNLHIVGNWQGRPGMQGGSKSMPSNVQVHGFLPYSAAEQIRMECDVLLAPYQR